METEIKSDSQRLAGTKEEIKIERLKKKCASLREKSIGANKKVKELLHDLHYANLGEQGQRKVAEYERKEALEYKKKYHDLLALVTVIKER